MTKIFPNHILRNMKQRYIDQGLSIKDAEAKVGWELAEIENNMITKKVGRPKKVTKEDINETFKSKFRELTNGQ